VKLQIEDDQHDKIQRMIKQFKMSQVNLCIQALIEDSFIMFCLNEDRQIHWDGQIEENIDPSQTIKYSRRGI